MNEQSSSRLSGHEAYQALADMSKLIASSETAPETITNLLRILCQMFDGEGILYWDLDLDKKALAQRRSWHREGPHSKTFAQQSKLRTIDFGQSAAGEAWSQGEPRLTMDDTTSCLAFPLYGSGTISGVITVIGGSITTLDQNIVTLLNIISSQIGVFLAGSESIAQLHAYKEANEKLTRQLLAMEEDIREAKKRIAKLHEEKVQAATTNARLFGEISRELRSPLGGITSIVELLRRTHQTPQQREYTSLIATSAEVILKVLEDLVENGKAISEQAVLDSRQPEVLQPASEHKTHTLGQARVLVVSGLVGSTELIETYATASGISCLSTGRGSAALTELRQAQRAGRAYDVVFVERVLPDMDAFAFARDLRNDRELAKTPMILVSTFGPTGVEDAAHGAGFTAHIAKPMKQSHLLNTIQAVLQGSSVDVAAQAPPVAPMAELAEGKRVILVAEDNPVNQKVALLQLKELGYFCEVVTDGQEALDAAKQIAFDAILMDCQMPQMNGLEATRAIREWEKSSGRHVPIIAMTAQAMPSDRQRCIEAGMDDYMSKPVTYDKLFSVLSRWLNEERGAMQEGPMEKPHSELDFSPDIQQDTGAPVDLPMLTEMLGAEEATEILRLFIGSSEELMDKIGQALNDKEIGALREATHTLKGACSSIGANYMWRDCIDLEGAAKAADWGKIPNLYVRLENSFEQAKVFIKEKI